MSWFKLNVNDSLNTLKGQISNVSNVVQEVFTEGILDANDENTETETDSVVDLEAAIQKIDELHQICANRDEEVSCLNCAGFVIASFVI